MVHLDEPADLVITSGGGYPLDATFYRVSKALTGARDILRKGGSIVAACECREGVGSPEFCGIIRNVDGPRAFFSHYCRPENLVLDQWCAQNICQAIDHAGALYVYSPGLSSGELDRTGAVKIEDLQGTIDTLLGTHPRVVALPEGPYVVGRVEGS